MTKLAMVNPSVFSPDSDISFSDLINHPAHLIRRSYQIFLHCFDEAMSGLDLSPISWITIAATHSFPGQSVTEIARRAGVDKASCGRTATALAKRDLICIAKSESDGRLKVLTLTTRGERLYKEASGRVDRLKSLLLDDLNPNEHNQFISTLQTFVKASGKRTRPSIPTMY